MVSIDVLRGLASKVSPPLPSPALLQNHQHRHSCIVEVCWKLIRIPAQQEIAPIRINAAKLAGDRSYGQFVLKCMPRQGGVIRLDVELEMIEQFILAQESQCCCRVGIILMRRWLFRLRLNQELSFKADILFVINRHVQKTGKLLLLVLHVRIQEGVISFTSAPEYIVFATKLMCGINCSFYLGGSVGEHMCIRVGGCPQGIAGVTEEVCCSP